jgi:hypothetical protein
MMRIFWSVRDYPDNWESDEAERFREMDDEVSE